MGLVHITSWPVGGNKANQLVHETRLKSQNKNSVLTVYHGHLEYLLVVYTKPLVLNQPHCTETQTCHFLQEGCALQASDSQRLKETEVLTHQLIIHDAFKGCAAALGHHGNCILSCYTMVA